LSLLIGNISPSQGAL